MCFKLLKNKQKPQQSSIISKPIFNKKSREKSTGRSMVEILGVLAIIGVLSIGGIQGYTIAMHRYRANEILNVAKTYANIAYMGAMKYAEENSEYFKEESGEKYGIKNLKMLRVKTNLPTDVYKKVTSEWWRVLSPNIFDLGINIPSGVSISSNPTYTLGYYGYTGQMIFRLNNQDFIRIRVYLNSNELCKTLASMTTNLLPNYGDTGCPSTVSGASGTFLIADFHMN